MQINGGEVKKKHPFCHQHKGTNTAGKELGGAWEPPDPAGTLSPIVPPGPSAMAGAPWLWAEALLITEPLLHSAIRPQGGFMQNDTQYK